MVHLSAVYLCFVTIGILINIPAAELEPLKICKGGRIETFENLKQIKECHVIEGNLIIAYKIANSTESWRSLGGLDVWEVTGYVIFFFVDHLTSLGLVLPNLRVIRGNSLFSNYALVVYGLTHLETIGLNKLTTILRGSVNIQSNPELNHYVHKVDWNHITAWNNDTNHLTHFNFIQSVEGLVPDCPENCPERKNIGRLCWSRDACQIVAVQECPDECLGGCYRHGGKTLCFSCKYFRKYHNPKECSTNNSCFPVYEMEKYRCVDKLTCTKEGRNIIIENKKKLCVENCPISYNQTKENVCIPCRGCRKVCTGALIDSVEVAQSFYGCTHISGSLEIRVFGSKIIKELVNYLGQIQEVEGFVHVFNSDQLTSLSFFGNLTTIHGKILLPNNYSFLVHDNDNLQELWNTTNGKLNITTGRVMFHGNPKLCSKSIELLVGEDVWRDAVPDQMLRSVLNGNKRACNVDQNFQFEVNPTNIKGQLKVSIAKGKEDFWKFHLAGFHVYFKEARKENLDYYGGRAWSHLFAKLDAQRSDTMAVYISNLKPATKYAVYLETRSIQSLQNFESVIKLATTEPYNPSVPENLKVSKQNNSYIEVSWDPPLFPNGNIDHYIVIVEPLDMENVNWNKVEICSDKTRNDVSLRMTDRQQRKANETEQSVKGSAATNSSSQVEDACTCSVDKPEDEKAVEERREFLTLANDLSLLTYVKEPVSVRYRRDLSNMIGELENICGKADLRRLKRSLRSGRLTRVLGRPSNGTAPSFSDPLNPIDIMIIKAKLIELSQTIPISNFSFTPYFTLTEISKECIHYLYSLTGELLKQPSQLQNQQRLKNVSFCNENLGAKVLENSSWEPNYCQPSNTSTEYIVHTTNFRMRRYSKSSRYKFKVKACHAPSTAAEGCGPQTSCKLCSLWFATKVVHFIPDSRDLQVKNVRIVEQTGNRARISWTAPAFAAQEKVLWYDIFLRAQSNNSSSKNVQYKYCENSSVNEIWIENLPAGNNSVEVAAFSAMNGKLPPSSPTGLFVQDATELKKSHLSYLILPTVILIVIFISLFAYVRITRESQNKMLLKKLEINENPTYPYGLLKEQLAKIDPKYLYPTKNLVCLEEMGQGEFGVVYRGSLRMSNGVIRSVAAKKLKPSSVMDSPQLIEEASLMLELQSYHLVRTYGIAYSEMEIFLVMELMHFGDLKKYLQENKRGDNILNLFKVEQVMKMGVQIADAMAYLEHKKILHRDLAARNCLLDGDLNVKVSDFGMSRTISGEYYRSKQVKKAPIRWMPPEYILEEKFTARSDVWSYGILLWEIVNPGKIPYMNLDTKEVEKKVSCGHTLSASIPSEVPSSFSALMTKCWYFHPNDRPDFMTIVRSLLKYTDNNFKQEFRNKSFYYCDATQELGEPSPLSADEEANNEEDIPPSTPFTSPRASPKTMSREGCHTPKSIRKRLTMARWQQLVPFFNTSFSISKTFPFVAVRTNSENNQKN